jgi:hypothetical protein
LTCLIKLRIGNLSSDLASRSQPALDVTKKNVSMIKEATSLLSERKLPPSLHETNSTVKDLVKERRDTGKKLLTLGAALLIMPDPITDAAAVPVLIAGKVMHSRHPVNIKNVCDEMRQTLTQISSICSL